MLPRAAATFAAIVIRSHQVSLRTMSRWFADPPEIGNAPIERARDTSGTRKTQPVDLS